FRGKEGTIKEVDLKRLKVTVNGVEITKNDGTKVFPYLDPSNLQILELKTDDKARQKALARKGGK
ncbi:50S ribosomal protein L24, partial [Candidatus Woesearchaeota archaeon]|nr:50S ribosomal protein L24 [Candidatus Woesearchaeota archaeon]